MDCSAVVLNKLLSERSQELWARLKLAFLDPAFSSLYSAISKHYDKYSAIPSFDDLEIELREGQALTTLATIKLVEADDISAEVAIDALIDQYTQNEAIKQLDKFIDKLPMYDTVEIKENLANIVTYLDEKTLTTEGVFTMSDIILFKSNDDLARERVWLGLNNAFDAALAGVARQELILVGGERGSGKSVICSNIQINEYEAGFTCPYFTIEMIAQETMERNMAILAGVNAQHIKQGNLTDQELLALVKARAGMFEDTDDLVNEFILTKNRYKFEQRLVREKKLKPDNQMIIIDDRALSITSLDLHLGKIKSKFGDKFRTAVVDYLNQIVMEGFSFDGSNDQFGWKTQTMISKKLKELARKHDIVIFSPYQRDASGEARFGKGILDAADIALVVEAHPKEQGAMSFGTTKIRGGPPIDFTSSINWETLRISPQPIERPATVAKEEKKTGRKKKEGDPPTKHDDTSSDLGSHTAPWD